MKSFIVSAAALLLASTAADAAKFDISYQFSAADQFSAVLDGTVSGGLFTVTGVDSMSLNGVASPLSYDPVSTDLLVFGSGGPAATFSVDGSFFDLYIWDHSSSAFTLNIGNGVASIYGEPIVGATTDLGGTDTTGLFDPSAYSGHLESAAPEPASWALMLGGFGLVGGALRSRRKAAVSFA